MSAGAVDREFVNIWAQLSPNLAWLKWVQIRSNWAPLGPLQSSDPTGHSVAGPIGCRHRFGLTLRALKSLACAQLLRFLEHAMGATGAMNVTEVVARTAALMPNPTGAGSQDDGSYTT